MLILRAERRWSLDHTADIRGVSKAMLAQIERGESSRWRVADRGRALRVGETLRFAADIAHAYHNPGDDVARIHDLIHYRRVTA